MPFHFKRTEPPARAVKRLCRERINVARDWLRQGDRPKAVHGLRKEIKWLRAALRLVSGDVAKGDYRKVTKGLRAAADSLAASRDARVMLNAFEELTGRSAHRFPAVKKELRKHSRRELRRFRKADAAARANRRLRKTKRRVADLKIKADGWPAIEPGLRQSYRRGQAAWKTVRRAPSPERFHEWRKHVKNLGCHLQLLCPAWPAETRAAISRLEKLGDTLGKDHDLALLREFIVKHCASAPEEVGTLERLIAAREEKLRAAALELGKLSYAETPSGFCRRLGKDWNAWWNPGHCH